MASGLRLAAATAAGSGTPDATTFATAVSSARTDPASVLVPARVTRSPDDLDLEAAEAPAAVARPGQRDGVADEQQPVRRLEARDERPQPRIDVDAVGDQLDEDRVVEQGRDGHARRTVVDPGHRVEQVRRGAGAGRVAGPRLLEGRARMADRDRHAAVARASR